MAYQDSPNAWFVAIASSLLFFLVLGNTMESGVLFIPLMEAENLSRGDASWPFSLLGVAFVFVAPLIGVLVNHYTPARLSLIGSLCFVLGQLPGFFTTNIFVLSLFYGAIRGLGAAILATVSVMIVCSSFTHRRSTAVGLYLVGGSIGSMVLPLVDQQLLQIYGLRGTFLLMAGVHMHSFVFSLALLGYKNEDSSPIPCAETEKDGERTRLLDSSKKEKLGLKVSYSEESEKHNSCGENTGTAQRASTPKHTKEKEGCSKNFTKNLNMPTSHKNSKPKTDNKNSAIIKSLTKDFCMMTSICTNFGFVLIALTQFFCIPVSLISQQVLLDYLREKGISESISVYAITSISVGSTVSKFCLGLILDQNILSFSNFTALFLVIGSVAIFLFTITYNVSVLFTLAAFCGSAAGAVLLINSVHVNDYVSKEEVHLTQAFIKSIQGLAYFVIPPIIGLFRDILGSYDYLFYFMAAVYFVMAIVSVLEGIYFKFKKTDYKNLS